MLQSDITLSTGLLKLGTVLIFIIYSTSLSVGLENKHVSADNERLEIKVEICPTLCTCERSTAGNLKLICSEVPSSSELGLVPPTSSMKIDLSQIPDIDCSCSLQHVFVWARQHDAEIEGTCFSPLFSKGKSIQSVSEEIGSLPCGGQDKLDRKRREVLSTEPQGLTPYPCDFENNFCQWLHTSDDEFDWSRQQNETISAGTGPGADHTTGFGYYIYIETSYPRNYGDQSRLVGPTLAPVKSGEVCMVTFWRHMKGNHVGYLRVYEAPLQGAYILKYATNSRAYNWTKEEVVFNSTGEFQVIFEGERGIGYKGDIALDDISYSSGCHQAVPTYVRLTQGATFNTGQVELYNGTWGGICDTGGVWSKEDAVVACQELGFQIAENFTVSVPQGTTAITSDVKCNGNEKRLRDCPNNGFSEQNCTILAGVTCTDFAPVCHHKTHFLCSPQNNTQVCLNKGHLCDYKPDCWDGADENNCENYTRCNFQNNMCGWEHGLIGSFNWTRHSGNTPSSFTGPSSDHLGNANGYYLYMEVSGKDNKQKAVLGIHPRFRGDHNGLCKVRFFYHMYGYSIGTLNVWSVGRYSQHLVWTKEGSQSTDWLRGEIAFVNTSTSVQIWFEGIHGDKETPYGDIAIDDISFTPECRPTPLESVPCTDKMFTCGSGECIDTDKMCDFSDDCFDASDETACGSETVGRCDFEKGFCDWNQDSTDNFDWMLNRGSTISSYTGPLNDHTFGAAGNGQYALLEASTPRVEGDKLRLISPHFMLESGNASSCTFNFFYNMRGYQSDMGSLRVYIMDAITGTKMQAWSRTGNQGSDWHRGSIPISVNWKIIQVIVEGERGPTWQSDIALDDFSFTPGCYVNQVYVPVKNFDVRLVNGQASNEGRVEIYRVGQWGTICDDDWDLKDADVVCQQLGYGSATKAPGQAFFGPGSGQVWLDNLACVGNETKLSECKHNGWSIHDCTHKDDAGVICGVSGGTSVTVRLNQNNNYGSAGAVEVYYNDEWGMICYDNWQLHDAYVICRQIGYDGILDIGMFNQTKNKLWLSDVECKGNESHIGQCSNTGWGTTSTCQYGYAGVYCKAGGTTEGDLRLEGGSNPSEGRVEIYHNGEWGTICDDDWIYQNAIVVCRQLGFTTIEKAHQSFGPGKGHIWLDQVFCNGTEAALEECNHRGWGIHGCGHYEDVGIICSDAAYVGCYKDKAVRAMPHQYSHGAMTHVVCQFYCQKQGFAFAGVEFASDCFCGDSYDLHGKAPAEDCSMPCPGDPKEFCGGAWRLTVLQTNPHIIPSSTPGYPAVSQSCYTLVQLYNGVYQMTAGFVNETLYYRGNHSEGSIWSPRFPNLYPSSVLCVWVISVHSDKRVRLDFESFETESDDYDFVELRDGKTEYDTHLGPAPRISGKRNDLTAIISTGNLVWVRFVSDVSLQYKGFKFKYSTDLYPTTQPPPPSTPMVTIAPTDLPLYQKITGGCHSLGSSENGYGTTFGYYDVYHNSGFIHSPYFPNNYPSNMICNWEIHVVRGYGIEISVTTFDFIYPGDSLVIDDLAKFSQSYSQTSDGDWVFSTNKNFVRVALQTDGSRETKGFKLTYKRVETVPSTGSPTTGSPTISKADTKHNTHSRGLSGAVIALIIMVVLVFVIVVLLLLYCIKKKKRPARSGGALHSFDNEAYTTLDDGTVVFASNGTGEPIIQYNAPPPAYAEVGPGFDPTAYSYPADRNFPGPVAVAEPPHYTPLVNLPPPPVYAALAKANAVTTTGLGSVTSLRTAVEREEAAALPSKEPLPLESSNPAQVGHLPRSADGLPQRAELRYASSLPPIRGAGLDQGRGRVFGGGALPPIGGGLASVEEAGALPSKPSLEPIGVPALPSLTVEPSAPPQSRNSSRISVQLPPSDIPVEFLCPLTNNILKEPVVASDGFTYERSALVRDSYYREGKSPRTHEPLVNFDVRSNEKLRQKILRFQAENSSV